MMKALATLATLLLGATLGFAQAGQGGMQPSQGGMKSGQSSMDQTAIHGCLTGTSGSYRLVANDGMSYELKGHNSDLRKNVGKEVEIMGNTSSATSRSSESQSAAGANAAAETFQVQKVNKVADTCQSGAGSNPAGGGMNENPPTPPPTRNY